MASEFFLKLPGIDGEATTKGFEDQIQLQTFNLGCTQPHSAQHGTGLGAAKADWMDFTFTKQTDKSSPKLMEACAKGAHIQDAKVIIREAGGESPVEYLTYEFKDLLITSYHIGGHDGSEKTTDSGSFSFSEIKKTYQSQDEKGQKKDKVEFGWSIKKNAPV
jgi:type VI secretion system secreted protein Hcp